MNTLIIGGAGHIGSSLATQLVREGHNVTVLTRSDRQPYNAALPEWQEVRRVRMDRAHLCADPDFFAGLRLDVVCDILAFTRQDMEALAPLLENADIHLVHIGTNWIFGHKQTVPVTEAHPRTEPDGYGGKKAEIERCLETLHREKQLRYTAVHPGHVSGPGWVPVNPQGNFDIQCFQQILDGESIDLPFYGMATLQHVHADDLAELIATCIRLPHASVGESFLATAPDALTQRGYVELLCGHYGREPRIRYVAWQAFLDALDEPHRTDSREHVRHSPVCSMEKARDCLGFMPRYRCFDTVLDAVLWQVEQGYLKV